FQAEDGIRDFHVTGVQTCALPISAAVAAKKAFLVNRVGDLGLLIAIMLMFSTFGTVAFSGVLGGLDGAGQGVLTAIGLLLLLGRSEERRVGNECGSRGPGGLGQRK